MRMKVLNVAAVAGAKLSGLQELEVEQSIRGWITCAAGECEPCHEWDPRSVQYCLDRVLEFHIVPEERNSPTIIVASRRDSHKHGIDVVAHPCKLQTSVIIVVQKGFARQCDCDFPVRSCLDPDIGEVSWVLVWPLLVFRNFSPP